MSNSAKISPEILPHRQRSGRRCQRRRIGDEPTYSLAVPRTTDSSFPRSGRVFQLVKIKSAPLAPAFIHGDAKSIEPRVLLARFLRELQARGFFIQRGS